MLARRMLRKQVLSDNCHGGLNYRPQHCVCDDTSAQTPFEGIPVIWAAAAQTWNGHRFERGKLACL